MVLRYMQKARIIELDKNVCGSGLFDMEETAISFAILQRQKIFIAILAVVE